jgi:hypothetical protein
VVWYRVGLYYPLGFIGTVPRDYDMFRPTKEWEREKIKIKELKVGKCKVQVIRVSQLSVHPLSLH